MPLTLRKRDSGRVGKESKKASNNVRANGDVSKESSSSNVPENTTQETKISSQESAKDNPGIGTPTEDPSDESMKSIVGRSKHHPKLDPDSSSLGTIETGKEAKERDKNRASWVKTIGMRTLRLRKHGDSKSGKSVQNILAAVENDGGNNAATAGASGIPPSPSASSSLTEPGDTSTITKGHKKNVKKSSSSASTNLNGATLLSTVSTPSTPTATGTDGSTTNKSSSGPTGSTTAEDSNHDKQDPARFAGDGMSFKAKLIGILEVSGPRGDRICQEALSELKMAVKAAGEHKQKITLHVALDGLRIRDEKTGDCLYHHQVHKISFIAQDLTDTRAFGYIFGSPDMGHRFFGIKTEKAASQVVMAMRDLFQVVFDMKKKEIERAKQQLEMQQKYLATRAATEHTQKVEHKTSSIAETYIEGACALTTDNSSKAGGGAAAVPEVDLLNLEVELCSLQEGLENIHNNFSESVPFRGSTASISSDPMNPNKFSTSGYPGSGSTGGGGFSNDPFGDSFDPFESSGTGFNQGAAVTAASTNHHSSSMNFPSADPFAQVDPFPTPKFNNIEDSSGFFNTSSDPFDTPVGNFSFSFANDSAGSTGLNDSTASHDRAGFFSATGALVGSRFSGEGNATRAQQQRSSSAMADGITSQEAAATAWQASFDDNFVPGNANGSMLPLDIFTELDPLGTGRVRPFVDRKDFFQDLKNPPRKTLKDLYPSEQGLNTSQDEASLFPAATSSPKLSSKVSHQATPAANIENSSALTNSFSTNFNPVGFDSAFKSAVHASSMSKANKAQVITGLSTSSSGKRGDSTTCRSDSPPNYNPPAPPSEANSFTNNEYFVTSSTKSSSSVAPPPLLPPPSSASTNSPSLSRATKKSPQLLKQMTIGVPNSGSASMSPRTLPRNARFGKQSTIDIPSADEMSPIPNLTPPPRPPHGTVNKNVTLSTAVPRPYSGDKTKSKLATTGSTTSGGSSFAMVRPFGAPEPPPRPLQTTMITSASASPSSQQQQLPIVSPPPLPPKKTNLGPALSTGPSSVLSSKVLYTAEVNKKSETKENDLPLPLPSRKTASNSKSFSYHSSPGSNRYCVPPSVEPRYEFPETSTDEPQVPKMTMEQALLQVASLSLGQLASRLDVPVEKLSNYTIQQLAEKLSFIGLEDESAKPPPPAPGKNQAFGSTSQISMRFESNFSTNFDDDNDISTVSAPAGLPAPNSRSAASEPIESSFDKYAVFRELAAEAASGFSVASSASFENDSDDDRSRTQDKTLTGRDSSSERTLQIEHGASRQDAGGDASLALNTMDDITDANLSDDQDKFTLDDEEIDVGNSKWATFESNFDDSFASVPPQKQQEVIISQPIKLDPPKKKPESPWDSDEDNNREPTTPAAGISVSAFDDAKILQSLPPGPEEFDFQPFEKPAPITPPSAAASSVASAGRRSSREKDRGGFDSFKLEPKSSPSSSGGQFKRQSSGSSKHSLSKYSDYSDSGRHPRDERVRKNSRELLDSWDRREWDGRDPSRAEETWDKEWGDGGGGDRWDRGEGWSRRSDRDFDLPDTKEDGRRRRPDNWTDRRAELSRSDSRGSHSKRKHDRGYGRDSDEDYSIGSRRDGSLRHSGGPVSGSRSRGGSARTREVQISRENLEIDDEEDEVDDDDKSYASHHSNYSSHSRRKHRRHPPRPNHYGGPPRRHRRDYSPERYSNHESDFDDSCEEESTSRKRDHYERDYYGKPSPKYSGRGTAGRPSSAGKRNDRGYRDYDRDYYRDRRDDGRYYHHRGRDCRRAEEAEDNNEEGVRGDREPSDYSCEDAPSYRSGSRRHRGRRPGGGRSGRSGSRNYHYNTNSPSWDSDSPEREGSGDRRKLRFGSGKQSAPRDRAQSPRSTKIPKKPNHRFEDDFAGPPDPEIAAGDSFDSFQSDRLPKEPEDLTKSLPPQSPFEDNFVVQVNQQQGGAFDSNNIEFKRTAAVEDHFGTTGSTASGDVFFPAKFDVELEVEKEAANIAMRPLESSSSMTPIPTPSSADLTRSSPSFLPGKRLESIRSEEERLESSEDGADVGKGGEDDEDGNTVEIRKETDIGVSEKEAEGKPVLKKSDSFNIFNQEKDPFADDDFFK